MIIVNSLMAKKQKSNRGTGGHKANKADMQTAFAVPRSWKVERIHILPDLWRNESFLKSSVPYLLSGIHPLKFNAWSPKKLVVLFLDGFSFSKEAFSGSTLNFGGVCDRSVQASDVFFFVMEHLRRDWKFCEHLPFNPFRPEFCSTTGEMGEQNLRGIPFRNGESHRLKDP